MQRGIEKTDSHSVAVHCLEDTLEVATLHREKFCKGCTTSFNVGSKDHLAYCLDTVAFEEHVLRAAETDTLSTEVTCLFCITRRIGVGTNESLCIFCCKVHDCAEIAVKFGIAGRHLTIVNLTCRAVERDPVAFIVDFAIHLYGLSLVVNFDFTCTGYAAFTHTTGYHSSVAGHTAAHCEDALSHCHTTKVFGRCLDTDKHHFLLLLSPCLSIICLEYNLSGSCTRRCGKTLSHYFGLLDV